VRGVLIQCGYVLIYINTVLRTARAVLYSDRCACTVNNTTTGTLHRTVPIVNLIFSQHQRGRENRAGGAGALIHLRVCSRTHVAKEIRAIEPILWLTEG
jgi:hypothetical protein